MSEQKVRKGRKSGVRFAQSSKEPQGGRGSRKRPVALKVSLEGWCATNVEQKMWRSKRS